MNAPRTTLLVRVWSGERPMFEPVRPEQGRWILGRDTVGDDSRMSRRHCEVVRVGDLWKFTDLGSANGTFVDGQRIDGSQMFGAWRVLQVGRSLVIPLKMRTDVPLQMRHRGSDIVGPGLHRTCEAVKAAVVAGRHVVLLGRWGCGFEVLAAQMHAALGGEGELLSVRTDAPTVPTLPERGTVLVRGSASLTRYAELPVVHAVLENPRLRLCLALAWRRGDDTLPTLPEPFASTSELIMVPLLAARAEEIPWWLMQAVRDVDPPVGVDVTLPEACLLRSWARGIPNLMGEVRAAAERAVAEGRTHVMGRDLGAASGADDELVDGPPRGRREPVTQLRERTRLERVLLDARGDHEAAARELGVTLEALGQWIRRHGLEAS